MLSEDQMFYSRRDFLAVAFGGALLGSLRARAAADFLDVRMHIDVHMHVIGRSQEQFDQAVARAVGEMDTYGIAQAVVFPPPIPILGRFDYQDYAPALRRHPGRFGFLGGGGTLNPIIQAHRDPQTLTSAVRQAFADQATRMLDDGAAGFGEMTALHLSLVPNHPFEQVSITHPLFLLLTEIAAEHQAVIDLHMDAVTGTSMATPSNLKVPPNPPTLQGNIDDFERLLAHDRDAKIVWAHGGSDFTGNMTPALIGDLMDRHSNLFMSLRPLPLRAVNNPFGLRFFNLMLTPDGVEPAWLELLTRHSDRFTMGADTFMLAPSVDPTRPAVTLSRGNQGRLIAASILLSRLPASLATEIGTENAVRLYRL
ncbi:MAG: hypothetical protein JO211_15570 [Acidobacteriaceae bacterium]|nr:hypothetical protein [Acidobacteriaceae bacterium]